jgi:hypothetical protein
VKRRRFSRALLAAVAEASPRRPRTIGPSHAERRRFLRAEDRDMPTWPRKEAAKCCAATRDEYGRLCIGFCSPECERLSGLAALEQTPVYQEMVAAANARRAAGGDYGQGWGKFNAATGDPAKARKAEAS